MGWTAYSNFAAIVRGTVLTLVYTPHVVGHPPPELGTGTKIEINYDYANNRWTTVEVVGTSEDGIMIQMPDNSRWNLSQRNDSDLPFASIDTGDIPSEDWIIRSAA